MNETAVLQIPSESLKPIRVLMADPDESIQSAYQENLTKKGFDVIPSSSGIDCLARLRDRVPDVLVIESQLLWGGCDGVLTLMNDVPRFARVPVMVLTSCNDSTSRSCIASFPVNSYQLKPLDCDRLAVKLRVLVENPRLRHALVDQPGRLEAAIVRRTCGRIRYLRVECVGGRVIVHGSSSTFYVKQLALAAVQEVLKASEFHFEKIDLNIEVS